jgi:hypothetical protein
MSLENLSIIGALASHKLSHFVGRNQFIGSFILKNDNRLVGKHSRIVIDGFPRSGNSSTVAKFKAAQNQNFHIGHHIHHPFQIERAVRLKIPVIVMIRDPKSAIISLRAFGYESLLRHKIGSREALTPFVNLFQYWISYYKSVSQFNDDILFASSSTSIKNFDKLICEVNNKWFTSFRSDYESFDASSRGWHAMPSSFRNEIKSLVQEQLEYEIRNSAKLHNTVKVSEELYKSIKAYAV